MRTILLSATMILTSCAAPESLLDVTSVDDLDGAWTGSVQEATSDGSDWYDRGVELEVWASDEEAELRWEVVGNDTAVEVTYIGLPEVPHPGLVVLYDVTLEYRDAAGAALSEAPYDDRRWTTVQIDGDWLLLGSLVLEREGR